MKRRMDVKSELVELGLSVREVHLNLPPAELTARALAREEGILAANGALVVKTGTRTGRSPADRFIVDEPEAASVAWSDVNQKCSPELFDRLLKKAAAHLRDRDVFAFEGFVGADREHRLPVRVVAEKAWHALFAHTLFLRPEPVEIEDFLPGFTVINCGAFHADPDVDGTRSAVFVGISFSRRIVLILGTQYAGEMKKALFTVMNYLLPEKGVLPLHCSANVGRKGDVALYFGLSGTGKTTLSADPTRRLVGDDEHGWADYGIFNFEGGCYAKVIRLSPDGRAADLPGHPLRLGARERGGRPADAGDPLGRRLDHREHAGDLPHRPHPGRHRRRGGRAAAGRLLPHVRRHGRDAADLRLTPEMAGYHFLSGFTAKVAGTEADVKEPSPTFSTCFGAPFMPRDPVVYASMLRERLAARDIRCWLVNTGWSKGPYGVGERMSIAFTRRLLQAALDGELDDVQYAPHPVFKVLVPQSCPDIPAEALDQRSTWQDPAAYDAAAAKLAAQFIANFRQYEGRVPAEVAAAGPVAEAVPA